MGRRSRFRITPALCIFGHAYPFRLWSLSRPRRTAGFSRTKPVLQPPTLKQSVAFRLNMRHVGWPHLKNPSKYRPVDNQYCVYLSHCYTNYDSNPPNTLIQPKISMLTCACCKTTSVAGEIERDAGDWIIRCQSCGAKNVLAATLINKVPVTLPGFEVIGWRE